MRGGRARKPQSVQPSINRCKQAKRNTIFQIHKGGDLIMRQSNHVPNSSRQAGRQARKQAGPPFACSAWRISWPHSCPFYALHPGWFLLLLFLLTKKYQLIQINTNCKYVRTRIRLFLRTCGVCRPSDLFGNEVRRDATRQ